MRVIGIDAGYVNFAVCGVNSKDILRPYYWKNEPLFTGEFSEERLCQAINEWTSRPDIRHMLDEADVIMLERQMTMKFQAVNHCIRFRWWEKTREVNPKTFAAFFGLPQTRKEKKKASVDLVGSNTVLPVKKGKKDDLADAYLLALFHIFTSSPILKEGWNDRRDGYEAPLPFGRKRGGQTRSDTDTNGGTKRAKPAARPATPTPTSPGTTTTDFYTAGLFGWS